jgi:nucleoside phosphorylase
MPMELKPLVRRLGLTKMAVEGVPAHGGWLGGRRVVAIVTGMGTRLAATAVERLLDAVTVGRVVVVGITGAVDNDTPIGTLVLPEVVVDSATGDEHRPAPLGRPTAPGASAEAPMRPYGKMWTTDTLITDPDRLAKLRADGVVSLDMETAAIASVCERRGVPWSVFRVISDRAGDGSIDAEVFAMSNQDGTPNPWAVVRFFVRHPDRLPRLVKLAQGARLATQRAADTAMRAVEEGA